MNGVFEIELLRNNITPQRRYHEFLRLPAMSAGLYILAAGATDKQTPHQEDEIYCVVRGRAKVRIGSSETSVKPGSVIVVEAGTEHRFFDIEEEVICW